MSLWLPYQQRWIADESLLQIGEKTRRCGFTWCSAHRAAIEGARPDRPMNTYYTGYKEAHAKEFIRDASDFAAEMHLMMRSVDGVFKDVDESTGKIREIGTLEIHFPKTRKRIVALSSSPRNLRGIKGRLVLDEFAHHDNPEELLRAALANKMWGYPISIISTHFGQNNAFAKLIESARQGRYNATIHTVTLDDALRDGLYKRICEVAGQPWSPEAEAQWRDETVKEYGEWADEELFCRPSLFSGSYIPPALIDAAMEPTFAVCRFRAEQSFVMLPDETRRAHIDAWLAQDVWPVWSKLLPHTSTYMGEDFGRSKDLTVFAFGQFSQAMRLEARVVIELHNVPYDDQRYALETLVSKAPRFTKGALDKTGNGAFLAERVLQRFGPTYIEPIDITGPWYDENLPKLKARFEDKTVAIPADVDIRSDIMAFQYHDGKPRLPAVRKPAKSDSSRKGDTRHGDAGVALLMLDYAARTGGGQVITNHRQRNVFHRRGTVI